MYTSRFDDSQIAFSEATKRYKAFAELVQLIEVCYYTTDQCTNVLPTNVPMYY